MIRSRGCQTAFRLLLLLIVVISPVSAMTDDRVVNLDHREILAIAPEQQQDLERTFPSGSSSNQNEARASKLVEAAKSHADLICSTLTCGSSPCTGAKDITLVVRPTQRPHAKIWYFTREEDSNPEVVKKTLETIEGVDRNRSYLFFSSIVCTILPTSVPFVLYPFFALEELSIRLDQTLLGTPGVCERTDFDPPEWKRPILPSFVSLKNWIVANGKHVWNSVKVSGQKSANLVKHVRLDALSSSNQNSASPGYPIEDQQSNRIMGAILPASLTFVTGTLARIFNSSPLELEKELTDLLDHQKKDWDLELESQIPLDEFLKRAKSNLKKVYEKQKAQNIPKERAAVLKTQYDAANNLLDDSQSRLGDFIIRKTKERTDPKNFTFGQLMDKEYLKKASVVTVADVRGDPVLAQEYQNLQTALAISRSQFVPVNPHGSSAECEEALITRNTEFRQKLLGLAAEMSSHPDTAQNFVNYLWGLPGNGKTTGVMETAKCAKIPVCLIDSDTLWSNWNARGKTDIQGMLKDLMAGCITGFNRNGVKTKSSFPDSFQSYYPDEKDLPTSIANGWIIWDDIDQFLLQAFPDDPKQTSPPPQRIEMANFFKLYTDHVANHTFSISGINIPAYIGGIKHFQTANSPLPELDEKSKYYFPPGKSRYKTYMVPYQSPEERKIILGYLKNRFYDKINHEFENHGFTLDRTLCDHKFEEILNYDIQRYKAVGELLGVRGLMCLYEAFTGQLYSEISSNVTNRTSVSNICGDHQHSSFDVTQAGASCDAYNGTEQVLIEEETLKSEISAFRAENTARINSISNYKVRDYLTQELNRIKNLSSTESVENRRVALEELKEKVKFATDRIVFNPEKLEKVRTEFRKRFSYLKNSDESWSLPGKSYGVVMNSIISKLFKIKDKTHNSIILLNQMSRSADPVQSARSIAHTLGIPFCSIKKWDELFTRTRPAWASMQSEKTDEFIVSPLPGHAGMGFGRGDYDVNFRYSSHYRAYVYESKVNGTAMLKYTKDGRIVRRDWSVGELEKQLGEIDVPNWWSFCSKQWNKGSAQGMIYISIPGLSYQQTTDLLDKVRMTLNPEGYKREDGSIQDLGELTIVFNPSTTKITEELVRADQGSQNPNLMTLPVSSLSLDQRAEYAKTLLHNELAQYGDIKMQSYLKDYAEVFDQIIQYDRKEALKMKNDISLAPLEMAIREIILKNIEAQDFDPLGMVAAGQSPDPKLVSQSLMKAYYSWARGAWTKLKGTLPKIKQEGPLWKTK